MDETLYEKFHTTLKVVSINAVVMRQGYCC